MRHGWENLGEVAGRRGLLVAAGCAARAGPSVGVPQPVGSIPSLGAVSRGRGRRHLAGLPWVAHTCPTVSRVAKLGLFTDADPVGRHGRVLGASCGTGYAGGRTRGTGEGRVERAGTTGRRATSDERAAFRERVFRGDRGGRSRRGTRDGTPTLPPRFPSRPRAAGRPPSPARGVRGALALAGRPAVEVGHGANNVRRCDRRGAGTDRRPGSPLLRRWPPGPAHRGRRRDPSSRRGNRRTGWSRRHRGTGPRRSQRLEETTSGLPTLGSSEVASPPSTRPFVSREADVRDRRSGGTKASLRRDQGRPAPHCERPLPPRRPRLRGGTGASHRPGPPPSSPPPGRADHRPRGAGPRPGRA